MNYGHFLVTITPPNGGQSVTLWLEVDKTYEAATLILASEKLRVTLRQLVRDEKPASQRPSQTGGVL